MVRPIKAKQIICPACNKTALRKREYKDSILYVHAEKGGLFGFVEITKACDVKKV